MRLLAPAKTNLHLRVAPATPDGFHPLLSWMCTVGLFDTLEFKPAAGRDISLQCDDPSLPCDGSNLVVRAARAMQIELERRTVGEGGLAITLQKRIPAGGGLGGGSSDAARTVLGLNQFWQLNQPLDRLSAVAASLGSDVAFFCHGPSSVCSGRGQIVRPVAAPRPGWALLILPAMSVPTGPVYRRFDELLSDADRRRLQNAVESEPNWDQWTTLAAEPLLAKLVNDLEAPAFDLHPALEKLRGEVEQALARIVRMSGSGSSLFTLFDDQTSADRAAEVISARFQVRAVAAPLAPRIDDDPV